ncbi:MAG: hypothetical protein NTY03_03760, partial [Candidatus Bathyarchaeota archaeon]|nr:hypothetical protein [Candidatus Bathyarchaeota archaeon]
SSVGWSLTFNVRSIWLLIPVLNIYNIYIHYLQPPPIPPTSKDVGFLEERIVNFSTLWSSD